MAKLFYRGMADQNGKPKIGWSARLLEVRPNIDIDIEQMSSGCVDKELNSLTPILEAYSYGMDI
jgi:hypothetical protein